jgi:hypothetical protein
MTTSILLLIFCYALLAILSLAPLWAVREVMLAPTFPSQRASRVRGWVVWLLAAALALAVVFLPLFWIRHQLGTSSLEAVAILLGALTGGLAAYKLGPALKSPIAARLVEAYRSHEVGRE